MNCKQVAGQGIAELYVIGKLKSSLQDEFEVHVLECKTCLKTLEVLEELRAALISSPRAYP
jgi:hypothetical protein